MKSTFFISIQPFRDFSAAVIAAGVTNPMECISKVEKDLRPRKVKGKVLFDLLLPHGSKSNRYFIGEFDGDHFSSCRFQNADEFYREFSVVSARIFKNKADQVDSTLLSRAMQFAIKRGIPF